MARIIFILLGIYLLYRFIFDFFIPVYKASRIVHRQFQDVHQKMHENGDAPADSFQPDKKPANGFSQPSSPSPSSKDYIDFEEVKD